MSTKRKPNSTGPKPKALAIYHVMRADEDFDDTADILFQLVKSSAASHPGQPRHLYFDVEGTATLKVVTTARQWTFMSSSSSTWRNG